MNMTQLADRLTESTLHNVLREEMCDRGWGVQQLADALGVRYTVASRWVAEEPSKRVTPQPRTLIEIASIFGLNAVDLFRYAGYLPAVVNGADTDPDEAEIQASLRRLQRILRRVPPDHRKAAFVILAVTLDKYQLLLDRLNEMGL